MENIMDTLITDRTQADVDRARYLNGLWDPRALQWRGSPQERAEWEAGPRGAYGFADMNRVTQVAAYLIGRLEELGHSVDIEDVTPAYSVRVSADPADGGEASGGGVFYKGDVAVVTARAGEKYDFAGWMESGKLVSGDAVYSFTVTGPRNLTAAFALKKFQVVVSIDPPGAGEATGAGTYDIDTEVTTAASAGEGYVFTRWAENGQPVAEGPEYTFTLDRDRALSAIMTKTHVIFVTANDEDGGTVSGGGTYLDGQTVTVAAVAGDGYEFAGWSENGAVVSEEAVYTFQAAADRELEAVFVKTYVIALLVDPDGSGTALGGGTYREGEQVSISATAGDGYRFVSWQSGGEQVSASNPYTLTVTGDQTLTALFEEIPVYTITASIDPEGGGTITGAGQYREGATVTLTATVNDGYKFSGWQENGAAVSADNPYNFTATGNRALVAACEEAAPSRLPAGYTEVKYVESMYCYIDTDVVAANNTIIKMDVEPLNVSSDAEQYFFYSYKTDGTAAGTIRLVCWGISGSIRGNMGKRNFGQEIVRGVEAKKTSIEADCALKKISVNGNSVSFSNGEGTGKKIYLLGDYSSSATHAKLYSCQIFQGESIVRNFAPCKDSSGTAGLYDLIEGSFYSGLGGSLTPGPAI